MRKLLSVFYLFLLAYHSLFAQPPKKPSSAEIYESIKKLNVLVAVLYIAAHPDDENTQLISYFSNAKYAETAYLSITRGDGGQNLIGEELSERLGLIRTQELLAARRTDGGQQFFTRAIDFGYSKHPDETLAIWNKNEVLKDVVAVIRKFKPDVIVNRFDHRSKGSTHGHHTSSAMLSVEAFDLANDSNFKGHGLYEPWQVRQLYFNTSWWFYGSKEKFKKADKTNMYALDVGVFYPVLGLSNTEIAALSRSQHKSQGFGATGSRGKNLTYLEFLKGQKPTDKQNIFGDINTTWSRVEDGAAIGNLLDEIIANYNFKNPAASLPQLLQVYKLIEALEDGYWKKIKLAEIKDIIVHTSGLFLEAVADDNYATGNKTVQLRIEAVNRSDADIKLLGITIPYGKEITFDKPLGNNKDITATYSFRVDENEPSTMPYWLSKPNNGGLFSVADKSLIGLPEQTKKLKVSFSLSIFETPLKIDREIVYKYNDPVRGEVYEPFEIVPKAAVSTDKKVVIFDVDSPKTISVKVTALTDNVSGSLALRAPSGWTVQPRQVAIQNLSKSLIKTVYFQVTPPERQQSVVLEPVFTSNGIDYTKKRTIINFEHIPKQTVFLPATVKAVRIPVKTVGKKIGYVPGAGDKIPESLREIGFVVTQIDPLGISPERLQEFDAVVLGIRLYNVDDNAKKYQAKLHEYVKRGGTLIVQYNTSRGVKVDNIAPVPLQLSKDRVSQEDAPVKLLDPKHPILNFPNKITEKDFENWVQERGLYFAGQWDNTFTPLLAMHDKGESTKKGSLLVADYGKGKFIYTGLSFLRELPAGVPGAYRLFANLIAAGKQNK
ncbi:MAG: LmbE family protein [Flavobacteriales bacterium]|nr:MAG: LmbE family protein [Flavobacteriales bacterium]